MTHTIGSLCTGIGGLDMAVEKVFNGYLHWTAENDPHAARTLKQNLTVTVADSRNSRNETANRTTGTKHNPGQTLSDVHHLNAWGEYQPAINRWAAIHGPPPPPTVDGKLNPQLPEWMLGYPQGHVTDPEIGTPRTQQLKMLGNAVQPQTAEAAIRSLLNVT